MKPPVPPGEADWRPWTDSLRMMRLLHEKPNRPLEIWHCDWGEETKFISLMHMPPIMSTVGLWWRVA